MCASATALGVVISNWGSGVPPVNWLDKLKHITTLHGKAANMPNLSYFGRAFASAGYALSTIAYHAEFGGLPPVAELEPLLAEVARLVDDRWSDRRRLTAVSCDVQAGHPAHGGFGVLPFTQHVRARWAKRGMELACSGTVAPPQRKWWIRAARELMSRVSTGHCRAEPYMLLRECGKPLDELHWMMGSQQPVVGSALRRLVEGLRSLPPVKRVAATLPPLGPWYAAMPLWENAFLDSICGLPAGHTSLTTAYSDVRYFTNGKVLTLGDAARLQQPANASQHTGAEWRVFVAQYIGHTVQGVETHINQFMSALNGLLAAIPTVIVDAVRQAMAADPAFLGADQQRLDQLRVAAQYICTAAMGWSDPEAVLPRRELPADTDTQVPVFASQLSQPTASQFYGLSKIKLRTNTLSVQQLSVRRATLLQLQGNVSARAALQRQCIDEAWGRAQPRDSDGDDMTMVQPLLATMAAVWQLKVENRFKQVW